MGFIEKYKTNLRRHGTSIDNRNWIWLVGGRKSDFAAPWFSLFVRDGDDVAGRNGYTEKSNEKRQAD